MFTVVLIVSHRRCFAACRLKHSAHLLQVAAAAASLLFAAEQGDSDSGGGGGGGGGSLVTASFDEVSL